MDSGLQTKPKVPAGVSLCEILFWWSQKRVASINTIAVSEEMRMKSNSNLFSELSSSYIYDMHTVKWLAVNIYDMPRSNERPT